jgi:prevent-host-death family protein
MPVSIVEDIKPITELKKNTREIFEQLHRTGRPIIVTVNGKPDAVLLDAVVFERKLQALNLASLLAEAEADVQAGRVRPTRQFLTELKHAKKVSR